MHSKTIPDVDVVDSYKFVTLIAMSTILVCMFFAISLLVLSKRICGLPVPCLLQYDT